MKQTQSAVSTNPNAASLGRDRREKSEITDIRRFCFAFWDLPSFLPKKVHLLPLLLDGPYGREKNLYAPSFPPSPPPSLTKNGREFEYMRLVNAADDAASSRPLAENTEAMRRWSLGGAYRRVARGPWRAYTRGPAKGLLKNGH